MIIRKLEIMLICLLFSLVVVNPEIHSNADELEKQEEKEIESRYSNISWAACSVSISSGTATAYAEVCGNTGTTSISATIHLEKLVNGSWQPYTSWSHNSGIDLTSSDSTNVAHGAYRVWMSVTAIGSGGTETFNVDGNTTGY